VVRLKLIKGFKNLLQSIVTVSNDFYKTYFREEKACEALDHIAPQNGEKMGYASK
jgi:hypothetical protein